ncbi:endonuclease/exonuclease/phosphatase family protein [Lapidilactobacillus wuchangensis]|uniref:endonuclease/exonuclease/phosphatase family protein n=1 Tax=Lapidilactobacillus wuchangensis TaxID=2486001 RepID=UPI000F78439D|nr:endonuclease/exonuclease/phosphatase family protein [Lapidilactobacillus wuchangensis]
MMIKQLSKNMKVITINLPPLEKAHPQLATSALSVSERAQIALQKIAQNDPEVVFFIEEYGPVFAEVEAALADRYQFVYPDGFQPSVRAYAGVVAAVKRSLEVEAQLDGRYFKVAQTAKILGLRLAGQWFLGVHYPQPAHAEEFDQQLKAYLPQLQPKMIAGDFNPLRGTQPIITGYRDLLADEKVTSLFNNKLDFVFVPRGDAHQQTKIFDTSLMTSRSDVFLSDHALTGLVVNE